LWENTLWDLARSAEALVGRVDWITKRWLFQQFIDQERISWSDPWLKSQDLEFHQVDPTRNLGLALAETPPEWETSPAEIANATYHPPANTRAQTRSRLMHLLKHQTVRYFVDWEVIDVEGINTLNLLNPFDASPPEVAIWTRKLNGISS
jgi:proteasome accessory factor A